MTQLALNGGLCIAFAIPDHPWVDSADGAAVRVAMTVGTPGNEAGRLLTVSEERDGEDGTAVVGFEERVGVINPDLTIGADVVRTTALKSNLGISFMGVTPVGGGFLITREEAEAIGLGSIPELDRYVRPFSNGKDLTDIPRNLYALDFFGMSADEVLRRFPRAYQWLLERVKPERDQNNREAYRKNWWIFAEPRQALRKALAGLPRYIATCRTAKHRVFVFLDSACLPDSKVVAIAHDDAWILGVLSSRSHVTWSMRSGAFLGVGNDPNYNNSECFDKYPLPACDDSRRRKIQSVGEQLANHRTRQQSLFPTLTLTGMYNVLEKLRCGGPLTEKEKTSHEQGLVSVLKQIHDDLDAAVFDAYGWPRDLSDEEILRRLVDLNRERAAEEARGIVRWLRPEFQNPQGAKAAVQAALPIATEAEPEPESAPAGPVKKQPWPKPLAEQVQVVRAALASNGVGMTPEQLARTFQRAQTRRVAELLETLVSLGQAREVADGRYVRA